MPLPLIVSVSTGVSSFNEASWYRCTCDGVSRKGKGMMYTGSIINPDLTVSLTGGK